MVDTLKLEKDYLVEGQILKAGTKIEINQVQEESDDWAMINMDGDKWYVQKIDSTHFQMTLDPSGRYRPAVWHVGQMGNNPLFQSAVISWLKGATSIEGMSFDG